MSVALAIAHDPEQAQALLHPLRQQILSELTSPDTAANVAKRIGLPRQKVNYHLRELEQVGLLEPVEERKKGNVTEKVVVSVATRWLIDPGALGAIGADPATMREKFSWSYLVARAAKMIGDLASLERGARKAGKKLSTLTLDTDIRFASPTARRQFTEELLQTLGRLVETYNDESAPEGRTYSFFLGAHPAVKGGAEGGEV
ncbi:helix-turn-helix domain-containing protein [bacterium]|nr:helix-turn-helix domain-containing protein [bacterium]